MTIGWSHAGRPIGVTRAARRRLPPTLLEAVGRDLPLDDLRGHRRGLEELVAAR